MTLGANAPFSFSHFEQAFICNNIKGGWYYVHSDCWNLSSNWRCDGVC